VTASVRRPRGRGGAGSAPSKSATGAFPLDMTPDFYGSDCIVYGVSVVAGYGHIAPKTAWGRLITIVYAVIGIPLTFLYLSNIGNFMADCFRLFYKRICCDVCCCQRCARRHKNRKLKHQRRRREIAAQRNESVGGEWRLSAASAAAPGMDGVAAVASELDDRHAPNSTSGFLQRHATTGISSSGSFDDDRHVAAATRAPNSTSGFVQRPEVAYIATSGCFENMRETDIVDDEVVSTSRDIFFGVFDPESRSTHHENDIVYSGLLKGFLESKETDIVSDPMPQNRYRHVSYEVSGHQNQSFSGRCKTEETEVKIPSSKAATETISGRLKDCSKATTLLKLHKSKSFSQADRGRAHGRIFAGDKPQRISNQSATGSRNRGVFRSTSANRLPPPPPDAKAQRISNRAHVGNRKWTNRDPVQSASVGGDGKRKLLCRSQSTRMSKGEGQRTLRRNLTVTAADRGSGGLAAASNVIVSNKTTQRQLLSR